MSVDYVELASSIGRLVAEKNKAYGDSFAKCGEFLRLLYPDGVKPEQYQDMLAVVRVFDKLMRVATQKDALGEDPWRDTAGYALLAIAAGQRKVDDAPDTFLKYTVNGTLPTAFSMTPVTADLPPCVCTHPFPSAYYCPRHGIMPATEVKP